MNKNFLVHLSASQKKWLASAIGLGCLISLAIITFRYTPTVQSHNTPATTQPNHTAQVDSAPPQSAKAPLVKVSTKPSTEVYQVQANDNLDSIFRSKGIAYASLTALINHPLYVNYHHYLHPGDSIVFQYDNQHRLHSITLPAANPSVNKAINKTQLVFFPASPRAAEIHDQDKTIKVVKVAGRIKTSFYKAAKRSGLNEKQIQAFSKLFANTLNFAKVVKPGSSFNVLLAMTYKHDRPISQGPILAALLTTPHQQFLAIRTPLPHQQVGYFNLKGQSLAQAFMRAPLHYKRISSPYNLHRFHPILHKYRPHLGVDFAAPKGTPVYAASNGVITQRGIIHGYGNVVIIKHNGDYSTRYAHLNGFAKGLHQGSFVREGQVIGYVGMTGLASAPNLHYELRIHGKAVDPMKAKLPHKASIAKNRRASFVNYAHHLLQ